MFSWLEFQPEKLMFVILNEFLLKSFKNSDGNSSETEKQPIVYPTKVTSSWGIAHPTNPVHTFPVPI